MAQRREPMDADRLAALVDGQINSARMFSGNDLVRHREKALEFVRGEVDIEAEPGKSSVADRSLSNVLNWILPSLLRVFLSSDRVAVYEPNKREMGTDEQGKEIDLASERANQATDYVNHVFLNDCNGYRVLQAGFYDGLVLGNGVVKHWWDPTPEYKTHDLRGLTDDQFYFVVSQPDVEEVLEHSAYTEGADPARGGMGAPDGAPAGGRFGDVVDGEPLNPFGEPLDRGVGTQPSSVDAVGLAPENADGPEAVVGDAAIGGLPAQAQGANAYPVADPMGLGGGGLLHDIKIKRRVSSGCLRVEALPPEEFLIDKDAKCLDESIIACGHRYKLTRSELVEMGMDIEQVDELPTSTMGWDDTNLSRLGASDYDGSSPYGSERDKSTELVDIYEWYPLVDFDNDGVAERRKILKGDLPGVRGILSNEEWGDDLPFTDLVPEPVPHRWKGRSLFDELYDVQRIKTVLLRQTLDNLYQVNNPMQEVVQDSILNIDALINRELGANVFVKQKGSVTPLAVEFTAAQSFQMLEYFDQQIEARTGVGRSSMGLDPDALQNQTAEAVRDSRAASATKNETYARNIAELGLKRLFRCVLRLITANQDRPRTIRLRGKWVEMDPSAWDADMDVSINVGLGTGSKDRDMALIGAVTAKQELILQTLGPNNPVVGLKEYRDTLAQGAEVAGLRNPERYFKEIDQAMLDAMSQQPPPPDPKVLEAQAKLQLEQQKAEADHVRLVQKAELDTQAMRDKAAAEVETTRQKMLVELEMRRQEMEQKAQLEIQKLNIEAQLKVRELELEAELKREQIKMQAQTANAANIEQQVNE